MPKKELKPNGPDRARTVPTPEERKEFKLFCARFPAFTVTPENTHKLFAKMWDDKGTGTETWASKLEMTFIELAVNGEINLNFEAAGDATVYALVSSSERKQLFWYDRRWRKLLEPVQTAQPTPKLEPAPVQAQESKSAEEHIASSLADLTKQMNGMDAKYFVASLPSTVAAFQRLKG